MATIANNHLDIEIKLPSQVDKTTKYGLEEVYEIKDSNQNTLNLTSRSIHLKKEIYKPGCLEIEFFLKETDASGNRILPSDYLTTLKSTFYPTHTDTDENGKSHTSQEYFTITLKRTATTTAAQSDARQAAGGGTTTVETELATDYVVRDVKVRRVKRKVLGTDKTVKEQAVLAVAVKAYSPDYFLTLEKYCQVYRGQKLSSIIARKTTGDKRFVRSVINGTTKTDVSVIPSSQDLRLCNTTRTIDNKYALEMLQPYLVQYNESFHDFVVRTANRCGELFYYEKGQLLLGPHKDYLTPGKPAVENNTPVMKADRDNVNCVMVEYIYKDKEKDVNVDIHPDQTINSMEGEISLFDEADIISFDNATKNLLSDGKMAASDAPSRDENVGMDELLRDVDSNKDSITRSTINEPHWFEIAHEGFQADGIASLASKAVAKASEIPLLSTMMVEGFLKDEGDPITITKDEATNANQYSSAPNANRKQELSNEFYSWIEGLEKKVTAGIQKSHRENLAADDALLLGQFVTINNLDSADTSYYIHAVDLLLDTVVTEGEPFGSTGYTVDLNIDYCPLIVDASRGTGINYQSKVFPVLADIPHIRKAEPQQATIVSTADPLRNGRVQIRYPWQPEAEGAKSPWINVTTPFTGAKDSGMLFAPDAGDYVMVAYEGGNIERPYVDGSLFHAERGATNWGDVPMFAPKLDYRKGHSAITKNGNGITFVDGKCRNFVGGLFPSFVQMILTMKDQLGDEKRLGGGMILSDYFGLYSIAMSSAGRSIDINSPWGKVNINAFTGITLDAPNGDIKISGKNVTIEAGNKVSITSGKNIKKKGFGGMDVAKIFTSATGSLVGSALKSTLKTNFGLDPAKILDVSFLRSCYEIIMRPVDGSLTITSKRNLIMQAGQGKAAVPASTLSDVSTPKKSFSVNPLILVKNAMKAAVGSSADEAEFNRETKDAKSPVTALIYADLRIIDEAYNELEERVKLFNNLLQRLNPYFDGAQRDGIKIAHAEWKSKDAFFKKIFNTDKLPNASELFNKSHEQLTLNEKASHKTISVLLRNLRILRRQILDISIVCRNNFKDGRLYFSKQRTDSVYGFGTGVRAVDSLKIDVSAKSTILNKLYSGDPNTHQAEMQDLMDNINTLDDRIAASKELYKRYVVWWITKNSSHTQFKNVNAKAITIANILDKTKDNGKLGKGEPDSWGWTAYISAISGFHPNASGSVEKGVSTVLGSILGSAGLGDLVSYDEDSDEWTVAGSLQGLLNINGKAGPRSLWDASQSNGEILMSSNSATYMLPSTSAENTGLKRVAKAKDFPELNNIL